MKDYHAILGVKHGASKEEIKKAFRTLAQRWHPDKQGGDEAKMKEINEAHFELMKGIGYDMYVTKKGGLRYKRSPHFSDDDVEQALARRKEEKRQAWEKLHNTFWF